MTRSRMVFWIFFAPVIMWLFLLIVLPLCDLLTMSFRGENDYGDMVWTLQNYINFFDEPVYWLTFVRTCLYAIVTTFIVFLLSMPVSFYIAKLARTRVQGALMIMLLLPFWVSELVRIYGWMILLRESGVLNFFMLKIGLINKPIEMLYNDATMIMGLVYTSMLFMVVPLVSVMDSLDDSLIEAAHDLGAGKWTIWRTIIIPHCKPGITSGSIVVFMLVLGNYLTPNLMGGKNSLWFTEQIYNQFIASFNWNQGSAFGFLLLILSSLIIWTGLKLTRQKLGEVAS
ncbi:ABC transporter permease [Maridesulfovibrio salexigens]|uniref:Binding-protein-dependent transport systems inner membrane component n=1 Tax=Maridesulfovibrio salexigens (strain ATCC 14822 / DSM 2638 / NCIMB 8403 / VKM B-1763) TaxID=526222 RepID=C6BRX4_MARSD|nr:ABC transporter permease [Maridesulfovibrio salexigens]ACS81357.1 binding-protein-dependent transport systems inner membrane component [Maridesulfovibrio salexigens DSM 2638]